MRYSIHFQTIKAGFIAFRHAVVRRVQTALLTIFLALIYALLLGPVKLAMSLFDRKALHGPWRDDGGSQWKTASGYDAESGMFERQS